MLSTTRALEALPNAFLTSVEAKTVELGGYKLESVRSRRTICSAPHDSMAPNWCGTKALTVRAFWESRTTPVASLSGASNKVIGRTPGVDLPRALTCPEVQMADTSGGTLPWAHFWT